MKSIFKVQLLVAATFAMQTQGLLEAETGSEAATESLTEFVIPKPKENNQWIKPAGFGRGR